jgi:hypothetical protein
MANKKTLSLCVGLLCAIALDFLLLQVNPDKGSVPFYLFIFFFPYSYLFSIVCNSLEGIIYGIGLYSSAFLPLPAYVALTVLAKSKQQALLRIVVFLISHALVAVTVIFVFQASRGR